MMMRALKAFRYANRKLATGDVFELFNEHGDVDVHRHVLLSAQLAEDLDGVEPKKKRTYKRRDMVAEE
jgi:uncharacterized protein VirK/YbjX